MTIREAFIKAVTERYRDSRGVLLDSARESAVRHANYLIDKNHREFVMFKLGFAKGADAMAERIATELAKGKTLIKD